MRGLAGMVRLGGVWQGNVWFGKAGMDKPERNDLMEYRWKYPGVMPVNAQTAGEELERIAASGGITAERVVDESRPTAAPLHKCFEWDDATAAEKYRVHQARGIINAIVVKDVTPDVVETRAFVHVSGAYKPIHVVINNADDLEDLFKTAWKELTAFQSKYKNISKLKPLFDAMKQIEKGA